uniref:5'-nucleotidase n=1 Tax=Megaselia scalaris TaxID=36166 RepID=T1H6Q2_MEGSC
GFPFDQKELDIEAEKCKDHLRDRSKEFFEILENFEVPVLVFSAGLGNSVESVLRQAGVLNKNVKIVSNFLRFKDNLVDGFQPPLIHNLNKNETVLSGSDFHSLVENRNNIILLGDSLGDADMSNGAPDSSNIIKIGFLFHHVKDNLEKYMDTFDIVLIDDQSMNV